MATPPRPTRCASQVAGHRRRLDRRRTRHPEAERGSSRRSSTRALVAVPRGRHRARPRDLHQGPGSLGGRDGRRGRRPGASDVEQPGARGRARVDRAAGRRRHSRQRRQPARLRGPQRPAARRGQGQQCVAAPSGRSSGCSTTVRARRRAGTELELVVTGATTVSSWLSAVACGDEPRAGGSRRPTPSDRHHRYPDGFVLFTGTLFAPTQDRDAPRLEASLTTAATS